MKRQRILRPVEPRAARFMKTNPRENLTATRSMDAFYTRPASEREPTVYPAQIQIKRYQAAWARDAHGVTQVKGGMSSGPTGGNSLGVVPRAFMR